MRPLPVNSKSFFVQGICLLHTYSLQGNEITVQQSRLKTYEEVPLSQRNHLLKLYLEPWDHPDVQSAMTFDFPEPLSTSFERVVDACHDGSIDEIEVLDRDMESETGLSAIGNSFLLEVLVTVAISTQNYELAKGLVVKGRSPPRELTSHAWLLREEGFSLPLELVTLFLDHHWLHPKRTHAFRAMRHDDSTAAIALLDTLVAREFLPAFDEKHGFPSDPREFWESGVRRGSVETLRHAITIIPVQTAVTSVWDKHNIARAAFGRPNASDLLQFLVDQQVLDVNDETHTFYGMPEPRPIGLLDPARNAFVSHPETALHVAVQLNRPENVQWLLEHGAKINYDGAGKTPFERAVLCNLYRVVAFFARYFEEKGLPFEYVDDSAR
ncbi:hypothetical protein GQ53DRAFT_809724 [Thozetella sp. PMI_491]|nr:hypothetical protein GQ53DRAFT_809724 [Thozetella sp. PMI_491]